MLGQTHASMRLNVACRSEEGGMGIHVVLGEMCGGRGVKANSTWGQLTQ